MKTGWQWKNVLWRFGPTPGKATSKPVNSLCGVLARGVALFLGAFTLLNVLGEFRATGFDANLWWIDLRPLPSTAANTMLVIAGLCFVAFAVHPAASGWRRWLTVGCAGALLLVALENAIQFYVVWAGGAVRAGFPVPFSTWIALALALVAAAHMRGRNRVAPRRQWLWVTAVFLFCAGAFPLAQMLCFGKTDYRRPADTVVVLGARAYADGRPSDALADRVRTACQLYREGFVKTLVFSGGPGDGAVHETEAMRQMAIELGVAGQDIVVDEHGLNTQATVRNSGALLADKDTSRVLVVSHFYHLPRIKMAFQREGREVFTVPAKETYLLRQTPYNMLREVAALWVYYLRPLTA